MNTASIIVLIVLLVAVAAAIIFYNKSVKKKNPCMGCNGDCASCRGGSKNI